jgi:hypothetical protein
MLLPGAAMPASHFGFDNNGQPSIFPNTSAVNSFVASYPGAVGTRGIVRGPNFFDTDVALSKFFRITEHQRVQVRAEAFNLFNNVNFSNPSTVSHLGGQAIHRAFDGEKRRPGPVGIQRTFEQP